MYYVEIFNATDYVDGAFLTAADAWSFACEHLTTQHQLRAEEMTARGSILLSATSLRAEAAGQLDGW